MRFDPTVSLSMPKILSAACAACLLWCATLVAAKPAAAQGAAPVPAVQPPVVAARSYVVIDTLSGQTLAASNADQKVEPASLTKMMTAYLVFNALKEKRLALDQKVMISQSAYKAIGSRMFIDPKVPVSVNDMLLGMIVQSGNDASIALAEAVGGTEGAFVDMMNKTAASIGLKNTRFTNSTGLPDPQLTTTATDMALLARRLIEDYPAEYATYYTQKSFSYNGIAQENRNRLLWLDPTVDGVKTGHTETAGYCLVASSKRPAPHGSQRRVIAVVMGTASMDARVQEAGKLLNWAFQNFEAVRLAEGGKALSTPEVWKGTSPTAQLGFVRDTWVTVPRGTGDKLKTDLVRPQPLVAPLAKGMNIGTLKVTADTTPVAELPVQVLAEVPLAGLLGRAWDSIRLWFK
jgi:serine-type D-Ala-D-Ala carboxypeptidase (penicillin-binding protein 5/6)